MVRRPLPCSPLLVFLLLLFFLQGRVVPSAAAEEPPTLAALRATVEDGATSRERADAAETIAERFFEPDALVPWLVGRLGRESDFHVRLALAYALAAQGDTAGLRILVDALQRKGHLGYVYLERVSEKSLGGPGVGWNRPAWVQWLEGLDPADWRELQRKRHLPRGPADADREGLERAIAWWNGLGYPDVASLSPVRVYDVWIQQRNEVTEMWTYGFLLEETDAGVRVFDADLQVCTLPKQPPEGEPRTRVAATDLVADVARDLGIFEDGDPFDVPFEDRDRDPFGVDFYMTPHRFRGFVLAAALHGRGETDLALRVWRHISGNSIEGPRHGRWQVLDLLRSETSGQAFDLWRGAMLDPATTWKESLEGWRAWRARFGDADDEKRREAHDRTEAILVRMAAEEAGYAEAARSEVADPAARAKRLVFALPTVGAWTNPDWGDRRMDDGAAEPDALQRLVALGPDAVPALLDALGDERYTRSAVSHFPHKGYLRPSFTVLLVQDLAWRALEEIAQRDFGTTGDGGYDAVREEAEAWWQAYRTAGEEAVLVEGVKRADASSPDQARRLVERYPAAAFAPIRAAIGEAEPDVRVALLQTLADLPEPGVAPFLEAHARTGDVQTRMAAARALAAHGRLAGVEHLLEAWPGIALARRDPPPGLPAIFGEEIVRGLVDLLLQLAPGPSLRRMRATLDEASAPLLFEVIDRTYGFLARGRRGDADRSEPPVSPDVETAAEALLVSLVLDVREREGQYFVAEAGGTSGRQTNRVGERAAYVVARLWPERYRFDAGGTFREREAARYRIVNAWREANGQDPLPLPARPAVVPVGDEELRPLLEAWYAAPEGAARDAAEAAVLARGLGVLPGLRRERAAVVDPEAKARLEDLLRRAAAIVREVRWTGTGPAPDDAMRDLVRAMEGAPARGRRITALFRQCALDLPEGATGIDLRLDRAGDDTGYVLLIEMTTHEIAWSGGGGGFLLGGDGQELVDHFLRDPDSWWHESRSRQLDELLLAPADEEVHVHRTFVRAREP